MTNPDAEQTGTSAQMLALADRLGAYPGAVITRAEISLMVAALRTAASQDAREAAIKLHWHLRMDRAQDKIKQLEEAFSPFVTYLSQLRERFPLDGEPHTDTIIVGGPYNLTYGHFEALEAALAAPQPQAVDIDSITGTADDHGLFAQHQAGASEPVAWRRRRKGIVGDHGWIMCPLKPERDSEFELQALYATPSPTTAERTECGCTDECLHKPECVFERDAVGGVQRD